MYAGDVRHYIMQRNVMDVLELRMCKTGLNDKGEARQSFADMANMADFDDFNAQHRCDNVTVEFGW